MNINSRTILSMVAREFSLKRSTIEERLHLQKTVYLLQASGLRLGYAFNWYKHGPYSQSLADDSFAVLSAEAAKFRKETQSWEFNAATKQKLTEFRKFYSPLQSNPRVLELLASIDFMCRVWGDSVKDPNFETRLLSKKKDLLDGKPPQISEISNAIELLKKLPKLN